jgi:beta-N-acetylhexosaminidase
MDLGKHFILASQNFSLSEEEKMIFEKVRPIGLFLHGKNFQKELGYPGWQEKALRLIEEFKILTGRDKIIICIDHEGGRIIRTPKPFTRTPAAGEYAAYAEEVGKIHGAELATLGINLLFGPSVDIFSNPANPVIGPRAFAETPEAVIIAAEKYIRGVRSAGLEICLKHFPGHGATENDTHHGFASVDESQELLFKRELLPFQTLIQTIHPNAIMTAHVTFPAFDQKNPATLSSVLLKDILRKKLGFQGVVISDDVDMGAIRENYSDQDAAKLGIQAGLDLLLFNHSPTRGLAFFETIEACVANGEISGEKLFLSEKRVDAFLTALKKIEPKIEGIGYFSEHQKLLQKTMSTVTQSNVAFGIEPRPRDLPPPQKSFDVRVGVVIESDERNLLQITPQYDSPAKGMGGETLLFKAGTSYEVQIKDNELFVSGGEYQNIKIIGVLKVSHPHGSELKPDAGIKLFPVIAGRHFHWKKDIEATYSGTLELHPLEDRIIAVNVLDFEAYIVCVVGSEMSGRGLPAEFSKAQATAARSWAYLFLGNKYPGKPYAVCNDDMSQRYQGTSHISQELIEQLTPCVGRYMIDENGKVVPGYYSKSTGGHGELAEHAYGFFVPGLSATFDCPSALAPKLDLTQENDFISWLEDSESRGKDIYCSPDVVSDEELGKLLGAVDTMDKYYRWEHTTSAETIIKNLREKFKLEDVQSIVGLRFGKRGVSGRYLSGEVDYKNSKNEISTFQINNQFMIRGLMHQSFLYSSAFVFTINTQPSGEIINVYFHGSGWGHGVGLCSIGALGMALGGKHFPPQTYEQILKHYYGSAKLIQAY